MVAENALNPIFARTPADPPAPGLYPGIGFADYCRWRAWNQSTLKCFGRFDPQVGEQGSIVPAPFQSPAHALTYLRDGEDPTPSQEFGAGYHTLVLEPRRFVRDFRVLAHEINRRTNAGKEEWAAMVEQFGSDRIVEKDDWDLWRSMAHAAAGHKQAKPLIGAEGEYEVSGVFTDAETGAACKFRLDKLIRPEGRRPIIVDLKTTRCAHFKTFQCDAAKFGYHVQAAMYCDGVEAITGAQPQYFIVAQEKTAPFPVVVYEMKDAEIDSGRRIYRAQLRLAEECVKSNNWPGYQDDLVMPLVLPQWAHADEPESLA